MRLAWLAAACSWVIVPGAMAQERAAVLVELGQGSPPEAEVRVRGALVDDRFFGALESGFPLHVEYRVELKRPRTLWDATVDRWEWSFVVVHDPVRDRYAVESPEGTEILGDRGALRRRLGTVYVVSLEPDGVGTYYYEAIVSARTLSDEDVDEVFAWLRGESADSLSHRRPGPLARAARRVLVSVAPLPSARIEAQSERFRHAP